MTADEFRTWMALTGVYNLTVSKVFGISRNTVAKYRVEGAPPYVAFACAAYSVGLKPEDAIAGDSPAHAIAAEAVRFSRVPQFEDSIGQIRKIMAMRANLASVERGEIVPQGGRVPYLNAAPTRINNQIALLPEWMKDLMST